MRAVSTAFGAQPAAALWEKVKGIYVHQCQGGVRSLHLATSAMVSLLLKPDISPSPMHQGTRAWAIFSAKGSMAMGPCCNACVSHRRGKA
jgi:hypothetical protein